MARGGTARGGMAGWGRGYGTSVGARTGGGLGGEGVWICPVRGLVWTIAVLGLTAILAACCYSYTM